QAEDGIRDFHVTGVQTCALPIYSFGPQQVGAMMTYLNAINRGGPKEWEQAEQALSKELEWLRGKLGKPVGADPLAAHPDLKADRSEERRVGKGCRSRWRAEQQRE